MLLRQWYEIKYYILMNLTGDNLAVRSFEHAGVVLVVLDLAGGIILINQAGRTVLGVATEGAAGKNWFNLFVPAESRDAVRATFSDIAAGNGPDMVCCESPIATTSGVRRSIQWRHTVLRGDSGAVEAVVCAGIDITERKRLEKRLLSAKECAEKANRTKNDFLTLMSHELRTPLTSIIGFSELLNQHLLFQVPDALHEPVRRILANGHVLLHLVNNILDMSRIESGSLDLASDEVDLRQLLDECSNVVAPLLASRPVVFSVSLPKHVPLIHTDRNRLKQVLLNILGNAIKFTEQGSITLKLKVLFGAKLPVRIQVADTGIGIPEERIGRIFERFSTEQPVLTRKFGGSGIGLAVSRAIIGKIGGAIEVRSTKGKGSLFTVLLPRRSKSAGAKTKDPEPDGAFPASIGALDRRGARLLIIDDDEGSRELMYHILRREGFGNIRLLESGEEMKKVTAAKPDLILLDLNMPFVSGQRLLGSIRRRRAMAGGKCIAVTAYGAAEHRDHFVRMGFDDYLAKPFTPHELVDAVKKMLHSA